MLPLIFEWNYYFRLLQKLKGKGVKPPGRNVFNRKKKQNSQIQARRETQREKPHT